MAKHLKLAYTDAGYCRVYYQHDTDLYCLQEEGQGNYLLYSCTTEREPESKLDLDGFLFDPIPEPRTEDEIAVMEFLESKGVIVK